MPWPDILDAVNECHQGLQNFPIPGRSCGPPLDFSVLGVVALTAEESLDKRPAQWFILIKTASDTATEG